MDHRANQALSLIHISTDHPPIYPVASADRKDLNSDEWKLYELIVRRFACTLLPEASVKSMAVNIDINGFKFIANGSTMLDEGWTKFYPYYKHAEVVLPDLSLIHIFFIKIFFNENII